MKVRVRPSQLSGSVNAPGSKSLMQRFTAAALMARGTSIIRRPQESADAIAALATAELLGADLAMDEAGNYHITGGKQAPNEPLNVGESGLAMRLFTPIAAMSGYPVTIQGEGSLRRRPIDQYAEVFKCLNAKFSSTNGCLPVNVHGPLSGGTFHIDGRLSSQFLSGLLMALPLAKQDSVIHVQDLKSTPYVDQTIEVMDRFGVTVVHHNYERFLVEGNRFYTPADVTCEGDWSGAAALLVAAALAGDSVTGVRIGNLDTTYTQADSRITGALLFAGAKVMNEDGQVRVRAHRLRGFNFDATDCPDLFPVLAALATACDRPSTLSGVQRLIHKESNRALTIQSEFAKAGIRVELKTNDMIIYPGEIKACTIDACGDHRIAMAGALLALRGAPITIDGAECVEKSYPHFFDDLKILNAEIHISNAK